MVTTLALRNQNPSMLNTAVTIWNMLGKPMQKKIINSGYDGVNWVYGKLATSSSARRQFSPLRMNAKGTYYFTRRLHRTFNITLDNTGTSTLNFTIKISDMPQFSEFTSLFDEYKILGTTCDVQFLQGNSQDVTTGSSPTAQFPRFLICNDYDDANVATYETLQQYEKSRIVQLGDKGRTAFKFQIPPFIRVQQQSITGATNSTRGVKSPWVDTTTPEVQHGTVKMGMLGANSQQFSLRIGFKIRFMMRGLR